jgi:hypothetical protein
VLVSPDGALGSFPFAALPGAAPESYLLEDRQLVTVPVPQLLPELMVGKIRQELPKELLVMGGVDYDKRASEGDAAPTSDGPTRPLRPWEHRTADAVAMRSITGQGKLPYLEATDGEAIFIKELYETAMKLPPGSDHIARLRGPYATEEEFRRLAPQCYMMHLATHGFFAVEEPAAGEAAAGRAAPGSGESLVGAVGFSDGMRSGLVFAGANNPPEIPDDPALWDRMPDDGFLTADEIAVLPLGSAQLVVLSACESGLGKATGGEGVLGVQRAFQVAGARSTIASLWKVNDLATRNIMEQFYLNHLEKGMSVREALRQAQLWALRNPDSVFRGAAPPDDAQALRKLPPQFWAAFTLSGAWD